MDMDAVQAFATEHKRLGRDAIASCGWWQEQLASGAVEPSAGPRWSATAAAGKHYVLGPLAPFEFERGVATGEARRGVAGEAHYVWAVYFGAYATNATGNAQVIRSPCPAARRSAYTQLACTSAYTIISSCCT
jgi:hypothetical protein